MLKRNLDLLIGIIIIIYVIAINCISSTRIAFSMSVIIIGIVITIFHFVKGKILKIINKKKAFRVIKNIFLCLFFVIAGLLCIIEGFIIGYPKSNTQKAEYIVVLGAGLRNGSELSITLKDRLDAAMEMADKDTFIVVSGGKGNDERLSEAEAMKQYLVSCGIDEDKVIEEDRSKNTIENLEYSKIKIETNSNKSIDKCTVKIVTTDFHGFRAAYIAEKNNYKIFSIYTSKSLNYLIPIYYFRESFAMVKTIIYYL